MSTSRESDSWSGFIFHSYTPGNIIAGFFLPTNKDSITDIPTRDATTPSDISTGIFTKSDSSIFAPMKIRTADSPTFRYWNRCMIPDSRK